MRTNWRIVGLLYVAGLLAAAQFAKIALTITALGERYPAAPVELAVGALSLVGIALGVSAGVVVARLGARRVILASLVAGAVFSLAQALLPAFPAFMALRVGEGAAHLALVVAAPTLMASVTEPKHTSAAMGLWGTFFGVGFALCAALIPLLGSPGTVFVAHAISMLAIAAALWPTLPQVPPDAHAGESLIARHMAIYGSLRLMAPALIFFWHTVSFLGLLTFLPFFLGGWTAPLLPLAALIGTMAAGMISRWISPFTVAGIGLVLSALGMILVFAAPEALRPAVALAAMVVTGTLPGASFAAVTWANDLLADRARANGAIAQFGNVGTALSVPLVAATLGYGLAGPVAFSVIVYAAGLCVVLLIHRKIAISP